MVEATPRSGRSVSFIFDEHFSPHLSKAMQQARFDSSVSFTSVHNRNWRNVPDPQLLQLVNSAGLIFVTRDYRILTEQVRYEDFVKSGGFLIEISRSVAEKSLWGQMHWFFGNFKTVVEYAAQMSPGSAAVVSAGGKCSVLTQEQIDKRAAIHRRQRKRRARGR